MTPAEYALMQARAARTGGGATAYGGMLPMGPVNVSQLYPPAGALATAALAAARQTPAYSFWGSHPLPAPTGPEDHLAVARGMDWLRGTAHEALAALPIPDIVKRVYAEPGLQIALGILPGAPGKGPFGALSATEGWHGSPYLWPAEEGAPLGRVDLSKIGTGEGAQAYGYGFYVGGKKGTGEYYRQALSGNNIDARNYWLGDKNAETGPLWDKAVEAARPFVQGRDQARQIATEVLDSLESMPGKPAKTFLQEFSPDPRFEKAYTAASEALGDLTYRKNPGSLYRLELQPEESDYLHWDKPLSEQSDKVKAALAPWVQRWERNNQLMETGLGVRFLDGRPTGERLLTGRTIYEMIAGDLGASDQAASLALRDAGIPGIKYLDQGSRAAGEGTHNYVIFDPAHVKVLERK